MLLFSVYLHYMLCSVYFSTYLIFVLTGVSSYAETAILKCYRFLTDKEYTQALIRLSNMTRGMGDPLVAAYARTYLCRVSE